MATLTVVSDLHLEARELSLDDILDPKLISDVLCLLGDIGDPSSQTYHDFLGACASRFRTVLLLAGNNEYRNHGGSGRTMAQTEELIRAAAKKYPNVHFLQNAKHVIGNVVFIGTTLWSHLPDTPLPPPSEEAVRGSGGITAGGAVATTGDAAGTCSSANPAGALPLQPGEQQPAPRLDTTRFVSTGAPDAFKSELDVQAPNVVMNLRISDSVTANTRGDVAVAASRLLSIGPKHQLQQQEVQQIFKQRQQAQLTPLVPVTQSQLPPRDGQYGLPFSIPSPRQERVAAGGGNGGGGGNGLQMRPPTDRGAVAAMPRFMSHSQPPPDWLTLRAFGGQCSGVADSGCDGACSGTGGASRPCRRRHLRHCVSLASLRPDEPCPSWRAMQAGCRRGNSASSSSSSESDALGSDSDSSQSSYSSDADNNDASPYITGDGCKELARRSEAAKPNEQAAATAASAVATVAAAPAAVVPNSLGSEADICRTSSNSPTRGPPASTLSTSELTLKPLEMLPVTRVLSQPVPKYAVPTSLPAFLSDPGSLAGTESTETHAPGALDNPEADVTGTGVAACTAGGGAAIPEVAPELTLASAPVLASGSASALDSGVDTGTLSTLKQRSHHHHHHHHHRHSSHTTQLPPPATVREFIGATSLDYRRIFISPGGPAITPDVTNALFWASLEYIQTEVAKAHQDGFVPIVLSHHAPSMRGTSRPTFAGHPSTHAYSSDLEPFLVSSGIAAWYCGHTHYNFDMKLPGDVRLASNQFGSQAKPADGYSRTWQHRLPSSTVDALQVGVSAAGSNAKPLAALDYLRGTSWTGSAPQPSNSQEAAAATMTMTMTTTAAKVSMPPRP
ncbi:hypothetical protein Vretimale_10532 [Volvox reticuliferus]|uniref:Calcineurin-like phosphoesterase domain-containing protein n=1 Tax=Volvox reticuliferus TaxID=1737510 RepID=A0A8J4CKY8_9CHLO|nr:hypothetical protein Vretifemale_12475 [Volvox reticuliferus]GIM06139.1 hypothetical protein Vretimale_10532 [Volvox reticuliferus]